MKYLVQWPAATLNRLETIERANRALDVVMKQNPLTPEEQLLFESVLKTLNKQLAMRSNVILSHDEIEASKI